MQSFFEFLRRPKDRRVDPAEMEGFGTEEPERPKTEYTVDPVYIMPDMPERRAKLGTEFEGPDLGISLTEGLEPGTEIPTQRAEQLNQEATAQRQVRMVKRVAQMREMALQRALEMSQQAMTDYLEGLEAQAQDTEDRTTGLREEGQLELVAVEEDEAKVLQAQADAVRELLQAKRKAQ